MTVKEFSWRKFQRFPRNFRCAEMGNGGKYGMLHRRGFLSGIFSAFAAPAIVRAASIMPVKVMPELPPLMHAVTPHGVIFDGYSELFEVTREAFIPLLVVQNQASPLLADLMEHV